MTLLHHVWASVLATVDWDTVKNSLVFYSQRFHDGTGLKTENVNVKLSLCQDASKLCALFRIGFHHPISFQCSQTNTFATKV
jgi:hypothetical protein